MFDARVLDRALLSGIGYRVGQANKRPVKCGICHIDCLAGQARHVILNATFPLQTVFLCVARCCPRPRGIADATGEP